MHRFKVTMSYDGTNYVGWQKQPKHPNTIQNQVELALAKIMNQPVRAIASGRTDAGVHALAQVFHCDLPKTIRPYKLLQGLNGLTPSDLAFHSAEAVPANFHALRSAEKKLYRYVICNRSTPTALRVRYSHYVMEPLDLGRLNSLSSVFLGEHDFTSLQSKGTPVASTIRKIDKARWSTRPNGDVIFEVIGNGFLKQMVRNMVGLVLEGVRRGKDSLWVRQVLDLKDRKASGPCAPAQGLFLVWVKYPPLP